MGHGQLGEGNHEPHQQDPTLSLLFSLGDNVGSAQASQLLEASSPTGAASSEGAGRALSATAYNDHQPLAEPTSARGLEDIHCFRPKAEACLLFLPRTLQQKGSKS